MHSALGLILGLALAALGNARVNLGTAATFGIVATTAITSTGLTIVSGDIGISPNGLTSITGSPPGVSTSPPYGADAVAAAAHADAQAAYNAAQALPFTTSLTDQDLGGLTFGPGVYNFASSAQLTGILTLDGQGSPNSVFVFQMGSTITTATAAQVVLINGAKACNVFWQVGSSATLRTATNFIGNILALASITVNSAVTVNGGLYALTAAVTLIEYISTPSHVAPTLQHLLLRRRSRPRLRLYQARPCQLPPSQLPQQLVCLPSSDHLALSCTNTNTPMQVPPPQSLSLKGSRPQ